MAIRYLLLDQLLYLKARGYDVHAISGDGPYAAAVRAAGIEHTTIPLTRRMSLALDLRAAAALVAILRRTRPDIVHTHTPKASLIGQWAARIAGVGHRVHTVHGLYLPATTTPGRRGVYGWLERLAMAPARIVLSQNREDIETCRREHLCDPRKVRYLGNGIDIERFHPRNAGRGAVALRDALAIAPGHLVVGTVARLVKEKGYLELFAAIPLVIERVPNVVFVVVGGVEPDKADRIDPADPAITKLGRTIRLLGHRDDVAELYGAMDLVVLPSHREGFPRAPMEAAATGVPVVATDIRGCRETVVDGKTGRLIPLGDSRALADAIIQVLRDAPGRAAMGKRARALAEERFDQRLVFRRVADAYTEIAGSAPGDRPRGDARDTSTIG